MGCGCCGGPSIGCSPALCDCDQSAVYRVSPIGIGGSAVGVTAACCASWNTNWDMFWISGPIPADNLACVWRKEIVNAPSCLFQQSCHLYALLTNTCRIYLEFTRNSSPNVDASIHCRYSCDDFDCDDGGVFANRDQRKCTGWPLTFSVSRIS